MNSEEQTANNVQSNKPITDLLFKYLYSKAGMFNLYMLNPRWNQTQNEHIPLYYEPVRDRMYAILFNCLTAYPFIRSSLSA